MTWLAGAAQSLSLTDYAVRERRRHQRVKVATPGRYMLEDRREFACMSRDMSPGGVALEAPEAGPINSRVIVYLQSIGRLEGAIARCFEGGFALALTVTAAKREKLADQLTWLANRHALGMPEDRRHQRLVPSRQRSTLRLIDGREWRALIIDVSRSGVAVRCDDQPPIGSLACVGAAEGRIVRHFAGGVALEFLRLLPEEGFDETVEL